jgi:cytochrome c-type biogenesis protein CcmH/NrfG
MKQFRRSRKRFKLICKKTILGKIMRKVIIVLSACIVVLLAGYTAYRGYQIWKQSHGLAMAKEFLAKGDTRSAMLSLQQVLHTNPRNLDASRLVANLDEAARSPGTLVWRQHVLELDPKSINDRLALVQSAIVFHEYPLATNTLAGVADSDKNSSTYHDIAGTVALMGGHLDDAESHFSEAIRLDPSNPVPQVDLAVVRLHGSNALDLADARIALQRVILNSTNAGICTQARRELILDAMRFNDMTTALTISQDLVAQTNAAFSDKLLRLNVLKKANSPDFKPTLAGYQREAAATTAKLFDLTNWQIENFSPSAALRWLESLPMETQTNETAAILAAQCRLQMGDWHGLQASIQPQNWNELEFMRHALVARALREQGFTEASIAEWAVAVQCANAQKGELISLFRLAAAWHWNTEAEQILWTVVNRYPEEKWADTVLAQALTAFHRTSSLLQLFSIMHQREPDNLAVENNLAMTALLLGAQEKKPNTLAQEVYEKSPTNADYASTYGFSLYLQGKNADALKVMQKLLSKDLNEPSIAGYYGLILKANGHPTEAKAYLNRSSQANLLPEEQTLFDQALTSM